MGKSTALCFSFITCSGGGGDSINRDAAQAAAQCKDSSDQRQWSFRKRSANHRVLSNSVVSEGPSSANKETPDNTTVNFSVQPDMNAPEKTSVINGTRDKVELTSQLDSELSDTIYAKEDENGDAANDESSIVIIQAAVRGLLAQKELSKQKNITKLQAVVRGYLVRRYAVGTLRCTLAIIKMQALVRAHCALLGKKEAKPSDICTFVSIEKLLSNAFALKLMESTRGPINIKCEPSKSDTAWKWLERWMSISSVSTDEPLVFASASEMAKENLKHSDGKKSIPVPSNCYNKPTDSSNSVAAASPEPPKSDDSLISHNANNLDSLSFKSSSPLPSDSQLHCINQLSKFDATESDATEIKEVNSHPMNEINKQDEKKPEAGLRDRKLVPEARHQVNNSSPEASPRCHTTLPEAETTPSGLVPVKPKKNKGKKVESDCKNQPISADTESFSDPHQGSASKSYSHQLQEHKISKKRNPVGSEKADHKEHKSRDSSSINSLPSYMQATESARAKAIANVSPRSSPDVHNKDTHIKKRHSPPGVNERQGSPGIQLPMSQAQQVSKENETYSSQERKWRR